MRQDRTVRVWQLQDGAFACTAVGVGHTEAVSAVVLSHGKQSFLVSSSKDTTMKVWDLAADAEVN